MTVDMGALFKDMADQLPPSEAPPDELGTGSVDGVETSGLGATISYEDMVAAQGAGDDDELADEPTGGVPEMEIPIEVWVDEMSIAMVMHFSDDGDAAIDIDVPEDSTDITDEFRDLVDQGGVDATGSPFGSF